ncbi:coenzyme F420-0:L-glutamate ligase [Candidatus Binatus sp.]|uniref:coenzyme F420-0:L-glutamate ligase n=1 Tax=Candidatus Binatus sp. TaxID=2811406 RepID=UPI002FD9B4B4
MRTISLTAIEGIPMVKSGDDLAALIARRLDDTGFRLEPGDILVVCQKVVSKAEGRVVDLNDFEPSEFARSYAKRWEKDPRAVEIVLRQTNRIVRNDRGVLIVETGPGWVCANAGVDESNSLADDRAILLPEDPDASARRLRDQIRRRLDVTVAVLITDTFGRPWRDGLTEVCLGIAGMNPILDLRGTTDLGNRELHHTVVAIADEIASAAGLLMEKAGATPAVVVRGYKYESFEGSAKVLIRPAEADLFR